MNWRSPLAIAGGLLITWSIIEWIYFGAIRPESGDCAASQIQSGNTCYNTWYYSFLGLVIGLSMLIPALIGSPKGTGFEAVLWSLGSLFVIPFIAALVYFNLQVSSGDQYVLQYGDVQYRIAFILEGFAAAGLVMFLCAYATYRYMRSAMEQLVVPEPKQIQFAGETWEDKEE